MRLRFATQTANTAAAATSGDQDVDQVPEIGNTRDVLSGASRAGYVQPAITKENREEATETKGPALPCGEVDEPA